MKLLTSLKTRLFEFNRRLNNYITKNSKSFIKEKYLSCNNTHTSDIYNNNWVVISGATGGIGESYTKYFNELGFNLLLIGRSIDKLDLIESKIADKMKLDSHSNSSKEGNKNSNDIKINTNSTVIEKCVIDFKKDSVNEIVSRLNKAFINKNLKVLINCIGEGAKGYDFNDKKKNLINSKDTSDCFELNINSFIEDIDFLKVNINSHILITKAFLLYSSNNNRNNIENNISSDSSSLVITLSSFIGGIIPGSGHSLYSLSKNSLNHFIKCISQEESCKSTLFINFNPWFIESNMTKVINNVDDKITSDEFVNSSINILYLKYMISRLNIYSLLTKTSKNCFISVGNIQHWFRIKLFMKFNSETNIARKFYSFIKEYSYENVINKRRQELRNKNNVKNKN